jgi:hypothetical protein
LTSTEAAGLAAATHLRGVNPIFQVQEGAGPFDRVFCDRERADASGNITLRVIDGDEFTGRVVIV